MGRWFEPNSGSHLFFQRVAGREERVTSVSRFFYFRKEKAYQIKSADPKIDAFCCQNRPSPSLLLQLTLSNLIQLSGQHRNDRAAVDELTRKHKEIQVKLTTAYRQLVVRDTAQQFSLQRIDAIARLIGM